ncbi:MAG: RluA family pseudouridine synthase [Muribaculaceae bacterium]|nr:RluA family pseudouridine synthase [Muribaculaceae bacterium]
MNNPFDYIPDPACDGAFRTLESEILALRGSGKPGDAILCRELAAGKMLGVLIAGDSAGVRHTLYAFSGQIGEAGFHHPLFVEPVFDYLSPDGYFRTHEREISRQSEVIEAFERGSLAEATEAFGEMQKRGEEEIGAAREQYMKGKLIREERRKLGKVDATEHAAMVARSQFDKAELRRIRKRVAEALEPYAMRLAGARAHLEELKRKRHADSEALQQWLFSNFKVLNARGESRSLSEIFAGTPMRIPPSGAGECCAPKLLQAAYLRGWHPEAMAEYWYGAPGRREVRRHGAHYPACRGKCLPVLGWMLRGLDVDRRAEEGMTGHDVGVPDMVYEGEGFCVVDKPSGMLSVPGKGETLSVERWLREKHGPGRFVKMVHRLDRDTSGLIIAAFSPGLHRELQALFARREVKKTYVAELAGDYIARGIPRRGRIELPLSPDWLDRPRQRVDREEGKPAVTDYEFVSSDGEKSRVLFHPRTGRTHQLRVHAASAEGLGLPIIGDPLYATEQRGSGRLRLHARRIEFTLPHDGHHYVFESPVPF